MRALVTGGTGFIGNHLVLELIKRKWDVVCLVRKQVKPLFSNLACVTGDLSQPETLKAIPLSVGKVDAVFHLAAGITPPPETGSGPSFYFAANSFGTFHLVDAATRMKAGAFIYASSISVVGKPQRPLIDEDHPLEPLNTYALSKLYGEQYCEFIRRTTEQKIISLRITSPYGPGMPVKTVLPIFAQKALAASDLEWMGEGKRTQNFVHVRDLVDAFLLAAEAKTRGVFNAAGPSSVSMKKLAETIVNLIPGSKSKIKSGGKPDPQDDFRWEIDRNRAESKLGYIPKVSLEQGIKEYLQTIQSGASAAAWWSPL